MHKQTDLPSVKVRDCADTAKDDEPVVVISGRDLIGTPGVIALSRAELEVVSQDLRQMAVAFRVAKAIEAEDAANRDFIKGNGGSSSV